ncbi:MAG: T9SS type A sorting domain-containing protein, partial [Chitinophagales bacterium]
ANIYNNSITNNYSGQLLYCIGSSAYTTNLVIHDNLISDCHAIDDNFGVSRAYYTTTASVATFEFYNNIISDITCANDLFETAYFTGFFGTVGAQNVFNNRVYNIISTSHYSGAQIIGFTLPYGVDVNVFNNMISNLDCIAGSSCQSIKGMQVLNNIGSATSELSHNTIYLSATGSATNFSSTALYINSQDLTLSNNIIANTSNHLGTGKTNAIERNTGMALTDYLSASNNNAIYAGIPGAGNNIFYDGTAYTTLASFQALVIPADNNSVTVDPFPFFTSVDDVHIPLCAGCVLENGGQPMPAITSDYDYESRSASAPEIGADELTIALPVTLIQFEAQPDIDHIALSWSTSTEINNDHFTIEKSNNGIQFYAIGRVEGNGSSTEINNYHFNDDDPLAGMNYYRLQQSDFNGGVEYSKIVSINWLHENIFLQVSPNPFTETISIILNAPEHGSALITIVDATGAVMMFKSIAALKGSQNIRLNTTQLPVGIYLLSVNMNGETSTLRIVKN